VLYFTWFLFLPCKPRDHVHEGLLKNFSRSGFFIESGTSVQVGDRVTIALPHFDDKRSGRIMWRSQSGFGVSLGSHAIFPRQPSLFYRRISSRVIRLFRNSR
jgi:hypothetical protein